MPEPDARARLRQSSGRELAAVALDDADDDAEDPEGRGENLHNEDLHKERGVLGVRERAAAARQPNRNPGVCVCARWAREQMVAQI